MTHRINRIRLEFKGESSHGARSRQYSINRIRLEFKADGQSDRKSTGHSINRIRLEFKDAFAVIFYNDDFVLIESDWNLKSLQHSVL